MSEIPPLGGVLVLSAVWEGPTRSQTIKLGPLLLIIAGTALSQSLGMSLGLAEMAVLVDVIRAWKMF